MTAITDLQDAVRRVAEEAGPSVVWLERRAGRGCGVVVDQDRVVTLASNLRGDEPTVSFADGRRETATLTGVDPDLGVAVLAVPTGGIEPLAWTDEASAASLGAAVIAVANPGGQGLRATPGFVASEGRSFRGRRGRLIEGAVEHTAPLPRGSGGGPLLDLEGRLLGINAVRIQGGLILALPAAAVRASADAIASGGSTEPRRLGVAIVPPRIARRMRRAVGLPERDGLLVRVVEEGSPAGRAGITRGDLIVAAGDVTVDGVDALYKALDSIADDGATLELRVVRGSDELTVPVSFGAVGAQAEGS
jgi:serine protease Do